MKSTDITHDNPNTYKRRSEKAKAILAKLRRLQSKPTASQKEALPSQFFNAELSIEHLNEKKQAGLHDATGRYMNCPVIVVTLKNGLTVNAFVSDEEFGIRSHIMLWVSPDRFIEVKTPVSAAKAIAWSCCWSCQRVKRNEKRRKTPKATEVVQNAATHKSVVFNPAKASIRQYRQLAREQGYTLCALSVAEGVLHLFRDMAPLVLWCQNNQFSPNMTGRILLDGRVVPVQIPDRDAA